MTYRHFSEDQLTTILSIVQYAAGSMEVLGIRAGTDWNLNKYQLAYILATADWESSFKPIEEHGGPSKPYAPYYGRGYVQLTHKSHYQQYGSLFGLDMVSDPSIALRPDVSLVVLVHGMAKGKLTGKKLGDYITSATQKDYMNARRIVNGQDQASTIAGRASFWEGAINGTNTVGKDAQPGGDVLYLGEWLGPLADGTEIDPRNL